MRHAQRPGFLSFLNKNFMSVGRMNGFILSDRDILFDLFEFEVVPQVLGVYVVRFLKRKFQVNPF